MSIGLAFSFITVKQLASSMRAYVNSNDSVEAGGGEGRPSRAAFVKGRILQFLSTLH
jgi:hypothetical protein